MKRRSESRTVVFSTHRFLPYAPMKRPMADESMRASIAAHSLHQTNTGFSRT
jgi:hypothetical protein